MPLSSVTLRAPILRPPTIRDHIAFQEHATAQWTREATRARMQVWTRLPIFYFSNPLCVIDPDEVVPYPAATKQLDYECELAAIVAIQRPLPEPLTPDGVRGLRDQLARPRDARVGGRLGYRHQYRDR